MSIQKEEIPIEKIVELLKKSEDDGTFYGTIYNLYFLIGIAKGVDDIRNGRRYDFRRIQQRNGGIA